MADALPHSDDLTVATRLGRGEKAFYFVLAAAVTLGAGAEITPSL